MTDIQLGDTVKVVHVDPDDTFVAEHTRCWPGHVGTVRTKPSGGYCWVEFETTCQPHGATGAVFRIDELAPRPGA